MEKLLVKKVELLGRNRQILSKKQVVGEVLFPKEGKISPSTIVARGERYEVYPQDSWLRKGGEGIMSAVKTKGVWCQLTINYMGRQYVADYTTKGWIVRSGVKEVGRFSYRQLKFAKCVPLLVQLYLLWYALENQPDIDARMRAVQIARFCGLTHFVSPSIAF